MKTLATNLRNLADRDHCVFSSADLLGAFPSLGEGASAKLAVIVSRAVRGGLLKRVYRGSYYYPEHGYREDRICAYGAATRGDQG